MPFAALGQSFIQQVERAAPAARVRLTLLYFDTCQAVGKQQALAFRTLDQLDRIGKNHRDGLLIRYSQFLRDTYAKNSDSLSNTQKAELFLAVGEQARRNDDAQIMAVCQHFAGLYYFLAEDYGRAFEYLLSANKQFREVGLQHIPAIHRYLYELAYNYYYFKEHKKAIALLREAMKYEPFSPNLHIQTYNTMALAYTWFSPARYPTKSRIAEYWYKKAHAQATTYRDTLWMGIITGNLADLYEEQQRWRDALTGYLTNFRIGLRFGTQQYLPYHPAMRVAKLYLHIEKLDSCRYFLDQAQQLYDKQRKRTLAFGATLEDEYFLKSFSDVSRGYFARIGNASLAYTFADSLIRLTNRINKRYDNQKLLTANRNLLIKQHQLELDAMNAENRAERLALAFAIVTLVLLAGLFALRYRASQEQQRQQQALTAEREKTLRLEKQLLEEELQRSKAELLNFVNSLQTNNVQSLLQNSLLTNDDWVEFRRRFEKLYPDFFLQLHKQLGDVSPAEERLLALSKLNLHIRQMSYMLGISTDSIRKTRYRLRKKFGMSGDASLIDILGDESADRG